VVAAVITLVWRWRTSADPNRPPGHRIAHPLAERAGTSCRLLAQGRNGNRLVEFDDGHRTVAPRYAARNAPVPDDVLTKSMHASPRGRSIGAVDTKRPRDAQTSGADDTGR
jgi:hypothetical protein